jgi:hypothetical protein
MTNISVVDLAIYAATNNHDRYISYSHDLILSEVNAGTWNFYMEDKKYLQVWNIFIDLV